MGIELTMEQVCALYFNQFEEEDMRELVDGYENWYIEADTNKGRFDAEKGAMYDYELKLYDSEGNHKGTATGGYYTGVTGHVFNEGLIFY